MATLELALVLFLQFFQVIEGYPGGAPLSTCFTQYPKHKGTPTQTTPSPFVVTIDPPAYVPGEEVSITVVDKDGGEFSGIQMAARRATENTEEIVGRFVDYDTDKLRTYNCFGGYQNMLTHAKRDSVTNMTFKWLPPTDNVGDVVFRSTFIQSFKVFWVEVEETLMVNTSAELQTATYPGNPLSAEPWSIDFDECGDSKGCFYYPRSCSGSDCKVAATYNHRESTNDFMFELYLNTDDANWVSIGFSHDEFMGEDFTMSCTSGVGQMSVQEGRNPARYNERLFNRFSSSHQVMSSDGKMQCRFVMPRMVKEYNIDQTVTDSLKFTDTNWDLLKDLYLFMAWGKTLPDSDAINRHADMPVVSKDKADLTENMIIFASAFHEKVQAHATVMIVAWVLFAGIVTVISRHYRDWMVKRTMCGSALWFQIHRALAILVAALTVVGLIIIFEHYGTGVRDMATPHAYVGFAAVGCVGLQLIFGMLRPHLEHSLRPVFNVGHRFIGHAAHILAAVTMFLAYEIDYISKEMREMGIITLSVWIGVQVFWHVMFEIIKRYRNKSKASNTYSIDENDLKPDGGEKPSDDCPHTTTLVTYILTLMGVCAFVISPIFSY